ncbi:MAG: hypothetical protein B7Z83_12405 [Thiomonas sp. 20-64-5]|nr:MAG: hypothetical protein B7Z83_12405 [Thiomonas sp. 20-64-5]
MQAQLNKSAGGSQDKRGVAQAKPDAAASGVAASAPARKKLSYKEQRELQELPGRIAALEAEQKALSDQLADPVSYTSATARIGEMQERFARIDEELLHALERWDVLDGK